MQPDASRGPVAVDRGTRNPQRFGYFRRGHSAEELHLHDLPLALIDSRQFIQSVVKSKKLGIPVWKFGEGGA